MNRIYLEYDNARITKGQDDNFLDVELFSGETYSGLEARRLFPITGSNRYISLLNEKKEEIAVIRDINNLMPDSKAAVMYALQKCYLIPKITAYTVVMGKGDKISIDAETDHGPCSFEIRGSENIKVLYDGRVLFCDTNDNRYEISDISTIDKKSRNDLLI
jgi:hypothetical protein